MRRTCLSLRPFLVLVMLFFGFSCSDDSSSPTDVKGSVPRFV